ncbi:NADH:ubiquinone reductase (Na(+)-transporting) s ubunit B [Desulfonema ishimotonii]|uniref:Na(+)-translocating NADH-quinone reductase subunit B n=1 Tax=Desulfonema ishimotonii TaxID=45657 RepID=A0A401G2G6_9BACT|nr:NADH:ubiquinone reductase (Na(+)-transporting) subunit B [Desulfonema ishimotonii]GBC63373.1 NADH:ubiquinone reductase (Na(+)-transporting) s ubunit B [Desulfonema ishimotonii]
MKIVTHFFGSIRKHFEADGRFAMLHPFYDAVETAFLWPDTVTAQSPHVRDSLDLKRFMSFVIVALIPPALWGIYSTGYQSHLASGLPLNFFSAFLTGLGIFLPMLVVSYAVGLFWETLFAVVRRHPISEGFLVTGLLFPLTLPPTMPLWQVAVGISFGVVIGKEVFGGTGRNILNPALTARAFVFFAYPAQMSGDIWTRIATETGKAVDGFTGATPLTIAATASMPDRIETLLSQSGYTLSHLFTGNYPGSIGATSALMCLAGAVILIVTGIGSYRTMLGGVIGVLATGWGLNLLADHSAMSWLSLNPVWHLVMGGFAFGIVYMATDPVSSPGTEGSKWLYGFLIGALTVLIRVFNPAYPEGVMLAILFMNIFAPLMDHFEIKLRHKRRIPNVW